MRVLLFANESNLLNPGWLPPGPPGISTIGSPLPTVTTHSFAPLTVTCFPSVKLLGKVCANKNEWKQAAVISNNIRFMVDIYWIERYRNLEDGYHNKKSHFGESETSFISGNLMG
jgi:hypothetical protein